MRDSKIGWTDDTINWWWGCTKISPACKNCYAAGMAWRKGVKWGDAHSRLVIRGARDASLALERKAMRDGERRQVFTNSMSDLFEDRPEVMEARATAFRTMAETPHLDWLLLTKRPQNIARLVPKKWTESGWPENVWLGVTAENQEYADERIPVLIQFPAAVRFISAEPLLGPIDLSAYIDHLDWIICGGESGSKARSMDVIWARSLRDQALAAGRVFFFKQWGNHEQVGDSESLIRLRKKAEGSARLDGVIHENWPTPSGIRAGSRCTRDMNAETDETTETQEPEPEAAGDANSLEKELESILRHLTDDASEVTRRVQAFRGKGIYETLYPSTKHGGDRSASEKRAHPAYINYLAPYAGSRATAARWVSEGEVLQELAPAALEACYGHPVAQQVGFLVRVARLPKPELHTDLVNIYGNAGGKKAKSELTKWEEHFGIERKTSAPKAQPEPTPSDEPGTEPTADETPEPAHSPEAESSDVSEVLTTLGVVSVAECVPAIRELQANLTEAQRLLLERHGQVEARDREIAALKRQVKKLQGQIDAAFGAAIAQAKKESSDVAAE